jgi:thymidylate synthase
VPKHDDLDLLGTVTAPEQHHELEDPTEQEVQHRPRHEQGGCPLPHHAPATEPQVKVPEPGFRTPQAHPDPNDEIIARHAEPERLAWMHANFVDYSRVAALGDADSYATRLFDYEHSGRDQIAWVVDRLRRDPASRSATITTFQPHTDTTYIPCVSMLDFWLPGGAVELVVYAHSIDFGAKGYGNLVELAALQRHVAKALELPVGRLLMTVKSAHVYGTELPYVRNILAT